MQIRSASAPNAAWVTKHQWLRWRGLGAAIDPNSRILYGLLIAQGLVAFVAFNATGFYLAPGMGFSFSALALAPIPCAWLIRAFGLGRVADVLETVSIAGIQFFAIYSILLALTLMSGPMADAWLASLDEAIGFNAGAVALAARPYMGVLYSLYRAFEFQLVPILLILSLLNQGKRAWTLLTASAIALILTSLIYPFFPAVGAFRHYGLVRDQFSVLGDFPWKFGIVIQEIKEGARLVDGSFVAGLVSFPSFHAAAAFLYGWSGWNTPLRWPLIALNVGMAASCIVGAHYLVDILAGAAIGAVAVVIAKWALPSDQSTVLEHGHGNATAGTSTLAPLA
jgi:membrane-associated phospholipid phosphatase